jgi:type I restriction enzyme S subunit
MSFPRYPKYKDSGVEWLGEVPEHWALPPLYLRYEVLLGKMLDTKKLTGANALPYVRNVDVQWDHVNVNDLPELDIAPDELERFTLRVGDILVCEGGEVGRTAIWRGELERCAFQKAIHRLRPLTSSENPSTIAEDRRGSQFSLHCAGYQ